ncbi:MAG: DNA-binding response regulator [Ignavibacteria bacterium RIFCSPLOWO2_12_FULL_56_21]|nr:MAG: DNA-binding response regulator [Ignavibacteria bacterium RIFCSPLOWO2_12_FULL_56_21]
MNVLIADDHMVVREGLQGIVMKTDIGSVVEMAGDGREALDMIEKSAYDLVILDISMPGLSGLEVLETIRRNNVKAHVLILSMHPQAQYAVRALRLGASGYLSKDSAYEELAHAIKKIAVGGRYVSPDLAESYLFDSRGSAEKAPHERLSEREFQIMCMLAQGKSPTEISKEINISVKTVSTHRSRILQKMGMKRSLDLMLYAIHNGLIE